MPIYAYRCDACGFAKDVLQKMSEDPLTVCPECNQASFKKQVTAAGFQLKGSGWYVTDFRGGNTEKASSGAATGATAKTEEKSSDTGTTAITSAAASDNNSSAAATSNNVSSGDKAA
jgi:putative FmdB family regulatory protein